MEMGSLFLGDAEDSCGSRRGGGNVWALYVQALAWHSSPLLVGSSRIGDYKMGFWRVDWIHLHWCIGASEHFGYRAWCCAEKVGSHYLDAFYGAYGLSSFLGCFLTLLGVVCMGHIQDRRPKF